jgi:hypothetical protein
MLAVLRSTTPAARASTQATLKTDLAKLDAQRTATDAIWAAARKAAGATAAIPSLPT